MKLRWLLILLLMMLSQSDAAVKQTQTITDADGDVVTLQLKGAGLMEVTLDDPDLDGQGPIDTITLTGTDAGSALAIKLKKVGDGRINIGAIVANGPLKSITGKMVQLGGGEGIEIDGHVRTLTLGQTRDSLIALSGAGAPAGGLTLGKLTIAGAASNSTLQIGGNAGAWKIGALHDSKAFIGFTPGDATAPFAGGTFTSGVSLKSLTIKGVKGATGSALAGSFIVAPQVGKVSVGSVATNNAGNSFGVLGQTIGGVATKTPKFKWNSTGPDEQGVGDFRVIRFQAGSPTNTPPAAPAGVLASGGVLQVTVAWNSVTGATSYNVYRAAQSGVNKGNFAGLPNGAKLTGVTSPFVDSAQAAGTTNYYVVTALNVHGESAESAQVSAIVQPPANLPPVAANDETVTLVNEAVNIFVLTNDSDPNGDPLTVTGFSQPGNGTVTFSNNVARYTPANSFTGTNTFTYIIHDGHGGSATGLVTVLVLELPVDPAGVAPSVANGVATVLGNATKFLYTGANRVQFGVNPDDIEFKRAAVIRGKVKSVNNAPLAGVRVNVPDHPEFGYTYSRADGAFDLAVNGGGNLVVTYRKDGYIPAHRQLRTRWQDYTVAPDVVLLPLDTAVTPVTLGAGVQVARGTVQADADGARRATLIVQPGTTGQFFFPNGATSSVTTLHLRLTEFTVGPNGPAAMPALLPITSAYTYCVDISADEEIAAGATTVLLSQPAALYIENFLGIQVGLNVPLGSYDPAVNAWVGYPNGRVVKILSVTGGLADVDTDGDAAADNTGLTTAEREQLASLYSAGQELWRMPIPHFSATTWDGNFSHRPPDNAAPPNLPRPNLRGGGAPGGGPLDNPQRKCGSIIEVENQILGEDVPIVGTPFRLHYQSDRVADFLPVVLIPVSGTNVPASAKAVEVDFTIAGRAFHFEFPPLPNLSTNFLWNGRDVYGRPLNGGQRLVGKTCYTYDAVYQQPVTNEVAWASLTGTSMILENFSRGEFFICDEWELTVNSGSPQSADLGGWTLDAQHVYDPLAQVLHYGDGRRRSAASLGTTVIDTVTGGGCPVCPLENVPAKEGRAFVQEIAVAADGTVYWTSDGRILYVDQDGIIRRAAGGGVLPPDGVPATNANFEGVRSLALAPDGSIYAVINITNIVHIGTDGIVRRFAGGGNCIPGMPSGDGGPATNACIRVTADSNIALGPDGSLYLADGAGILGVSSVRRVDPNGIISTVAGGGDLTGDNIPATEARINAYYIALGPDGALYLIDGNFVFGVVRRVGGDGKIKTIAGGGFIPDLDGGLPTDAQLFPAALAVGPAGILITETSGARRRVRLVAGEVIRTVIGSATIDPTTTQADGVPAGRAALLNLGNAVFAPDGSIYLKDGNSSAQHRIRRVASVRPGLDITDSLIAEEDGSEVFVFDGFGRHQQTWDALTGAVRYEFAYDAQERLVSVTDGDGNVTTIQRDGAGKPTGITGPYGQTTTFTLDGNGYLASIQNPANETVALAYTPGGLLTSLTDPRGHATTFSYDTSGSFLGETDPAGGSKTLSRTDGTNSFTVAVSTALGRTNSQTVVTLPTGARVRTTTMPDGRQDVLVENTDGSTSNVFANGLTAFARPSPDPRWGMLAPVVATNRTTTPGGLVNVVSSILTATLTDPFDLLSLSNLTETVVRNGNTWSTSYDATPRLETATSPAGRQVITEYDNQRRIMLEAESGLAAVQYTRDARGRTIGAVIGSGADQREFTYQYNAEGDLATVIDPLGRTNHFTYDAAGRLLTQTTPGALVIQYAYDANGNLTGVTPPGKPAHSISNSAVNLPVAYTAPHVGGSNQTTFAYNADRQVTQITRPDGRSIMFDYSDGGSCNCERLSKLTIQRGEFVSTYDPATGNLASLTAPGGIASAYAYDGVLLTAAIWTGPVTGAVAYAYNPDFRLATNSVNGANPIAFSYDADGLLVQAGALTLTRHPQHGMRAAAALGSVAETFTYNAFGETTNHTAIIASTNLYAAAYLRDKLGRITQKTETILGVTTVFNYQYDLEGRLTNTLENAASVAAYTYDANGNRLRVERPGVTVTNVYDAQDRLVESAILTPPSAISYHYAASGELTNKTAAAQTTSYTYDELDNLLQVVLPDATEIEYLTDGYNRRIGKKINGTLVQGFLYQDGLRPIAELDGNNAVVSRFVYAEQKSAPEYMVRAGVTYRLIADELGSLRLVVNAATGAVAQRLDYDEFGHVTLDTNPGFQPFGFAGGLADPDTGLIRFGRRDYDAVSGRWLSKDPDGLNGGLNLYAYAGNDPVNYADPTGGPPYRPGYIWDPSWPGGWRPERGGKKTYDENSRKPVPEGRKKPINPDPSEEPTVKIPLPPVAPSKFTQLAPGLGGAAAVYLCYRGIRLLPSLIPPLWPTLPANLAVP